MRGFLELIVIAFLVCVLADSRRAAVARLAQQHPLKIIGQSASKDFKQPNKVQAGMCEYLGGLGSCTICTNYLGRGSCGWCGATQECMEGNTAGPYYANCTKEWAMEPAKCGDCVSPKVSGLKGAFAVYNGKYQYAGVSNAFSYFAKGTTETNMQFLFFDANTGSWNIGPVLEGYDLVDVMVTQQTADPSRVTVNWTTWDNATKTYVTNPKVKIICSGKGYKDPCAQFADCDTCTQSPGLYTRCGWCHSTNKCASAALSAGPLVGKCDAWSSYIFQCPAHGYPAYCALQPNCTTCLSASPYCLWCEATKTCMVGTKKGPATGTCPYWTYSGAICPGEHSREDLQTCGSCLGSDQSVWCPSQNKCMPGSYGGPAEGYSCNDWVYFVQYCPENQDYCASYDNCGACTSDPACGWCQSSKKCLITTGIGPRNATCKDWRAVRAVCSAKPKKVVPNCATIGAQNCPAKDFNMLVTATVCAKSKCTKAECCSNTCSSFSKSKCPKYTTKTANSKTACETYTCTATECCNGKCSLLPKSPCDSGMTFNKTRICFGRPCLKEDCCQTTCQSFDATLCAAGTKLVANPAETQCQWSFCKTKECCIPVA